MENVTLVNNAILCMNPTWHDVAVVKGYHAQRTSRRLLIMRNTTQQLHNTKRFTLECYIGSHILQLVEYIGDRASCFQWSTEYTLR